MNEVIVEVPIQAPDAEGRILILKRADRVTMTLSWPGSVESAEMTDDQATAVANAIRRATSRIRKETYALNRPATPSQETLEEK